MNQRLDQRSEQQLDSRTQAQAERRSFDQAEEVIRADREQTRVPAELTRKVSESLSQEPPPSKAWWRRWLG